MIVIYVIGLIADVLGEIFRQRIWGQNPIFSLQYFEIQKKYVSLRCTLGRTRGEDIES